MVPSPTSYGLPFPKIGGLQISYPLLSQDQVKLRTSNLGGTFTGPIQVKAHLKFRRKWSVGVSRDCPNCFEYPLLSQERVKLRTSNFAGIFTKRITGCAVAAAPLQVGLTIASKILTPCRSETPKSIETKIGLNDYIIDPYKRANFRGNRSKGVGSL